MEETQNGTDLGLVGRGGEGAAAALDGSRRGRLATGRGCEIHGGGGVLSSSAFFLEQGPIQHGQPMRFPSSLRPNTTSSHAFFPRIVIFTYS